MLQSSRGRGNVLSLRARTSRRSSPSRVASSGPSVGVSVAWTCGVLRNSPKPTIAAVNGLAVAGADLSCRLIATSGIAAENAWFGVFDTKRGIMAGVAVNLLARYMALGDALYMLMTADRLSAEDALRLGLVQRVVPAGRLMEECLRVAEMIAANSQVAVQASKRVAYFWRNLAIRESIDYSQRRSTRDSCCVTTSSRYPRAFCRETRSQIH